MNFHAGFFDCKNCGLIPMVLRVRITGLSATPLHYGCLGRETAAVRK
jgi:hypothetical protein